MKIDSSNILAELERLGAAFPWDKVDIWITRQPEGKIGFVAFVDSNSDLGTQYVSANSENLADCVSKAIVIGGERDLEIIRQKKLAELRRQIEELQAVVIGMPPYRPNRELAQGVAHVPETVNV